MIIRFWRLNEFRQAFLVSKLYSLNILPTNCFAPCRCRNEGLAALPKTHSNVCTFRWTNCETETNKNTIVIREFTQSSAFSTHTGGQFCRLGFVRYDDIWVIAKMRSRRPMLAKFVKITRTKHTSTQTHSWNSLKAGDFLCTIESSMACSMYSISSVCVGRRKNKRQRTRRDYPTDRHETAHTKSIRSRSSRKTHVI